MKLLKVFLTITKSNSSDGNYAVKTISSIPIGTGELEEFKHFWTKKEAQNFINNNK